MQIAMYYQMITSALLALWREMWTMMRIDKS